MYNVFCKEVIEAANIIDDYLDWIDEIVRRLDIPNEVDEYNLNNSISLIRYYSDSLWYLSASQEKCKKHEIHPRKRHH